MLHLVLFWMFWPHIPARVATVSTGVIHAELIPDTTIPVGPSARSETPPSIPVQIASTPALATSHAQQSVTPQPPNPPVDSETPAPARAVGYLPIDAVDQPAMPLGDWVIDTDVLPPGYTLRLVLRLWISAGGTIDRWDLVGDTANPVLANKALVHLDQTPIQPALLNQIAVPSLRQLEIVLTRD